MKHYYFEEPVGEESKLNVLVEVGSVEIWPHDENLITIEVEARHMEVTTDRNENTIFVRAERDEAWLQKKLLRLFMNDNPEAHLTIHVPTNCQVDSKVITGGLSIESITAPVTARTVTGRIGLTNLSGPIYAKTVTGSIQYQGELTVAHHRFETTTGHISLNLSRVPDAQLDAQTTTGHIHCDLPLVEKRHKRTIPGDQLSGVLGSGQGRVVARVVTGKIELQTTRQQVKEKFAVLA